MFRGYWITAIALGLAWLLSVMGYSQEPDTNNYHNAAERSYDASEYDPPTFPIFKIESDAEAQARQDAEERAEQRELEDLAAQQGMNESAQKMADYAVYQTVLIAIGTVALIWTLVLTQRTASAAVAANTISRDMLYASNRPYLRIESITLQRQKMVDGPTYCWAVVAFRNISDFPALDVSCVASFKQGVDVTNGNLDAQTLAGRFSTMDASGGTIVHPTGDKAVAAELMCEIGEDSPTFVDRDGWTLTVCLRFRSAVGTNYYYLGCKSFVGHSAASEFLANSKSELPFITKDVHTYAT